MGRFTGILGRTSGHKRTDGFLVWPSDLVLAPLRELVSHVRRTLLTLTHNAGVKLGAVPSTDSDFENGGSTSKSANTTKPMDVACNDWAWSNSLHFGALTLASQQMAKSVANGYFGPYISSNWFSHPCASSTDGRLVSEEAVGLSSQWL